MYNQFSKMGFPKKWMKKKDITKSMKIKLLKVVGFSPIENHSYPQFCSYSCTSKAQNSTCDWFSNQWICPQMIIISLENDFERVFKIHHIWNLNVTCASLPLQELNWNPRKLRRTVLSKNWSLKSYLISKKIHSSFYKVSST